MIPTLMIGDFILVDKNIYGYKLPLTNITLFENESPKEVMLLYLSILKIKN